MIAPILATWLIFAVKDLDPLVTPVKVNMTGACSHNLITVEYKNDWNLGGVGAFIFVKYNKKDVRRGFPALNLRLNGRHISNVSLLTCSDKNEKSFSVLVTTSERGKVENGTSNSIGMTVYKDRIVLDPK